MSARWRLFITVVCIGLATYFVAERPANLGLDLKGGAQIVLDLKPRPGQKLTPDVANSTLDILRRRVDSLGVSEPNLEIAGNSRIIVELPGVSNTEQAVGVIGTTAQLSFHPVLAQVQQQAPTPSSATPSPGTPTTGAPAAAPGAPATAPATPTQSQPTTATTSAGLGLGAGPTRSNLVFGQAAQTPAPAAAASTTPAPATTTPAPAAAGSSTTPTTDASGNTVLSDDSGQLLQLGPPAFTGDGVDKATAQPPDQTHTGWYIDIQFKDNGAKKWTQITGQAACAADGDVKREVAIVLDNKIISHPQVQSGGSSPVTCNVGITGNTTEITGQFTAKQAQDLVLLINGGALPVDVKVASQQVVGPELGKSAIHQSIVAVIVGGVLTIAYLLIYYRFLGLMAAFALGVYGLLSFAVLKGLNLTLTLPGIAGFVLAIAMAMDSNVLVYERVKEEFSHGRSLRQASQMGFKNALSAIIDSNATTFIAAGTLFFLAVGEVKGFGVTLLVGTAVSIFTTLIVLRTIVTGLLGMEWARRNPKLLGMYVGAKFRQRMSENPPNLMKAAKFFLTGSVIVIIVALSGIFFKGINYGIEFSGGRLIQYQTTHPVNVDKARTEMGKLGFPNALVQRSGAADTSVRVPALTIDQATKVDGIMKSLGGGKSTRLNDETIGPSFGKELKHKAEIGLIIGVGLQLAWVAYRFRWTFGIGAVVAMVHDALLVLGLFAWLGKTFDAVFLAALLTIIAYSVNDTVVVFDRIREQRRRRGGEPFARVVSDACAQTFPRTVNIGLSVIFILGALFFLGGESLGDFSLALLVGVVTGIYSSVMVASPIAVLLERWQPAISARPPTSRRTTTPKRATKGPQSTAADSDSDSADEPDGSTPTTTTPKSNRPAPRPRSKSKSKKKR